MPELPEVETVCRTIAPHIVGRRIRAVRVRERRLREPISRGFEQRLVGRTIRGVRRRAKYVLLDVGDDEPLLWVVHLGMSGRLVVGDPPAGLGHVHVTVDLEGGVRLYFRDPRRFGLMRLARAESDLGALGVEPLGEAFDGGFLWGLRSHHRGVSVKALLLDQRRIAGLGNIYVNEALFRAGIRPTRRFARLSRADVDRIAAAVRWVLERAIESRGSSLLDYRDADGNAGEFQSTLRVYDRTGEPCHQCGTLVRRSVLGGRSSFYCPRCQH
jgi:formamidopyrimidine-DNA glycosylase